MRTYAYVPAAALCIVLCSCANVTDAPATQAILKAKSLTWYHAVDNNQNGWWSSAYLILDLDRPNGADTVAVTFSVRRSGASVDSVYYTLSRVIIAGTGSGDSIAIPVSGAGRELPRDIYNCTVLVKRPADTAAAVRLSFADTPALASVKFEPLAADGSPTLVLAKLSWSNQVDKNGNGYTRSRQLNVQCDPTSGSMNINALLYYRKFASPDFIMYDSLSSLAVTAFGSANGFSFQVGSQKTELPYDSYQFRLDVYERSTNRLLLRATDDQFDQLHSQHFERASEDGG